MKDQTALVTVVSSLFMPLVKYLHVSDSKVFLCASFMNKPGCRSMNVS